MVTMFSSPGATKRKVTQDDAQRAAATLGVDLTLRTTPEDVRKAFRVCLRSVHPDAGGDQGAAAERIKQLGAARETLLAWLERAPKADCSECGGRGFVFGRWGAKPCSRCGI
jgi:hypothetical protein